MQSRKNMAKFFNFLGKIFSKALAEGNIQRKLEKEKIMSYFFSDWTITCHQHTKYIGSHLPTGSSELDIYIIIPVLNLLECFLIYAIRISQKTFDDFWIQENL